VFPGAVFIARRPSNLPARGPGPFATKAQRLFSGVRGRFDFAALPLEVGGVALPVEPGVRLPTTVGCFERPSTGFVVVPTTEDGGLAPPIPGPCFAAPPTVFCFVIGPPAALWAETEYEKPVTNAPSKLASNVDLNICVVH